jgi:purine nucleosidase
MPRRIIIYTDHPGLDAAAAIRLTLAMPEELDVFGIVAVAGNA